MSFGRLTIQELFKSVYEFDAKCKQGDSEISPYDVSQEYQITYDDFKTLYRRYGKKTPSSEIINAFATFLEERWERIRGTDAAYPHSPHLKANQLCIKIAKIIYRYREAESKSKSKEKIQSPNSLLMPTVTSCDEFDKLKLDEFILSDDDTVFIPVKKTLALAEKSGNYEINDPCSLETSGKRNLSPSEIERLTHRSYGVVGQEKLEEMLEKVSEKRKKIATIKKYIQQSDEQLFYYFNNKESKEEKAADFDEAMILLDNIVKKSNSTDAYSGVDLLYDELKKARKSAPRNDLPLMTELIYRMVCMMNHPAYGGNSTRFLEVARELNEKSCCRMVGGIALIVIGISLLGLGIAGIGASGGASLGLGAVGIKLIGAGAAACGIILAGRGIYQCVRSKYHGVSVAAQGIFAKSKPMSNRSSSVSHDGLNDPLLDRTSDDLETSVTSGQSGSDYETSSMAPNHNTRTKNRKGH